MGPRPPDSQSVLEPMGRFIPHNRVRGAEADRGQSARMHIICLLVEVRGNDRGISVEFRGCCHELPWKSPGFHGKGHGSWHFHGKYHGCGHGTCRGSVRGKLRGTKHGNPRKSAAIATAVSADVKPPQFPRPSAAIRGHCHSNPPIRGNYHGSPRQLPRQFPQTSNHRNFHGHPRPSAAIATGTFRYSAITTEVRGNHHGNFHGRQTTAISTAIHDNPPIQANCHGSARQLPQQFPRHCAAIRGN